MQFTYPTKTARITQKFGENFKWNGKWMYGEIIPTLPYHNGIDFGVDRDHSTTTEVLSVWNGVVSRIEKKPSGYGNCVYIDCGEYTMLYGHLQDNSIQVKIGDTVAQGQVLAFMGSTGNSTSTHLHFELRQNGKWIDPTAYFQKPLIQSLMDYLQLMEQEVPKDQRVFKEYKGDAVLTESQLKALIEIALWRMRPLIKS